MVDTTVEGERGILGEDGLRYPIAADALDSLRSAVGHDFADPSLLGLALTHRSWCAEHAGYESNERLEFLGDSVLGMIVTSDIFRQNPDAGEGQLSRVRASVVCAPALAEMAEDLGVGAAMLLGKGEAQSGGRERPSILADAMEALIGAVYIDGGLEAAEGLVRRLVAPRLDAAGVPDDKSRLHERIAKEHDRQIRYEMAEDGPEHDKTFRAVVYLDDQRVGEGAGRSKKQAEQAAAREAWALLDHERGKDPAREDSDG